MSRYDGDSNLEFSYYYALPVPEADIPGLVAADDYGRGKNVELPIFTMTDMELRNFPYLKPHDEVCDAITRLWSEKNAKIFDKLMKVISCNVPLDKAV